MENETFYCDGQIEITDPTTWGASTGPGGGTSGKKDRDDRRKS